MAKPTAQQCAELAYSLAAGGQEIPYVYGGTTLSGLDCRGYVLYIIRALGGTVRFSGATDLWNNYLQYKDTTAKAKAAGKLVPGALLFHWDGKTAEHVGWYTGIKGKEVAHASQSNEKVVLSPISNYYDHVGWADAVDYTGGSAVEPDAPDSPGSEQPAAPGPDQAIVNTKDGTLTLRKGPGRTHAAITSMPKGTMLTVLRMQTGEGGQVWAQVRWDVKSGLYHEGWCAAEYLLMGGDAAEPEQPTTALIVQISGYQGGVMDEEAAGTILSVAQTMGYSGTILEADD